MTPTVLHLWADPTAFPVRVGTASGGTSSLTNDPALDLSALPRTVGNVMVLVFRSEDLTHSGPSGWTSRGTLAFTAVNDKLSVWSKVVGASEGALQNFIKSSSDRCGWVCFEFSGAHGDVSATLAEGLDPPSHSPAWGSAKSKWLTACGVSASDNALTAPTGYSGQVDGASAASTADTRSRAALAQRDNEAASENPSTWAASGTYSNAIVATIAVRPTP